VSALDKALEMLRSEVGVYAPQEHDPVEAARSELSALRQRCEDLELMLRAALVGRLGIAFDDDNVQWWSLDPSPGWRFKLADDGTGLPILTPEAREELRKR